MDTDSCWTSATVKNVLLTKNIKFNFKSPWRLTGETNKQNRLENATNQNNKDVDIILNQNNKDKGIGLNQNNKAENISLNNDS